MKSRHAETLRRARKKYHQTDYENNFQNGILARHLYDAQNPLMLTWWDDVTLIINNYRVAVAWTHPRQSYRDEIKQQASQNTAHLSMRNSALDNATPEYVKVGASRKKLVAWSTGSIVNQEWVEAFDMEVEKISNGSDYLITPSIKVTWFKWCRYVDICAPIEVRNEENLVQLARLVKKLLKHETTLDQEFPNYTYTKENWLKDALNDSMLMRQLHSHRLA